MSLMIGQVRQRSLFLLFSPAAIMLSITLAAYMNWYTESIGLKWLILLAVLNTPGLYLSSIVKDELGLDFDEFIMLNLMVGSTISVFTYINLSYVVSQVSRLHVFVALTLIVVIQGLFFYLKRLSLASFNEVPPLRFLQYEAALVTSGLVSSALVLRRLTPELWIGNDPWETAIVCRNIVKLGLSPSEALSYYETFLTMSHPLFYYLVSLVSLMCGVEVDLIVRVGPLVFAAVCGALTYVAVKRMVSPLAGFVAPLLLFLNPFFNFRFSMLLRENLSIMILVLLFTLWYARRRSDCRVMPGFIAVYGLLLAAITATHPFTVLFLLGLMAVYFYIDYANNRFTYIKEVAISSILCILLIIPDIPPMYIPVYYFLINNESSNSTIILIFIGVLASSVSLFVYMDKIRNLAQIFDHKWIRGIYMGIVLLLFSYIILKPTILDHYMYEYIRLNMFSTIVIVLGVLGFLFEPPSMRNIIITTVTVSVTLLVCVYLLGVAVPLDRTAVYTAWALSYYASLYLSKLLGPFTLRLTQMSHGPLDVAGLLKSSQQYLALIFLMSTVFYFEAAALKPSFTEFSSADIDSARLFVSLLEEGDLVIPLRTNYVLQYADVPRGCIVTTGAEREWMWKICDAVSPDQLFTDLPTRFMDVKHLKFCLLFNDLFDSRNLKPSREFLDEYGDFTFYGSLIVYTINLPYDEAVRPLSRVKSVNVASGEPAMYWGAQGDLSISDVSNVVIDPLLGRRILYLAGNDGSGNKGVWRALSGDGLDWEVLPEPVLLGEYSEPFVMAEGSTLRLFCVDAISDELVSFASQDGAHWSDRTVVAASHDASQSYWRASSPVAWVEAGSYHVIYEETTVSTEGPSMSLVQLTSKDCGSWEVQHGSLHLWTLDRFFWTVNFDRIIIDDVAVTDEGTILVVRALKNNYINKTWVIGTLFTKPERPDQTYFQEIEVINLPTSPSTVDAVHVLTDPGTGASIFYIYEGDLTNGGAGLFVAHPR